MATDNQRGSGVQHAATILSALDSEQRLQIVRKLAARDHVVHELVSSLGKSQPLISQHLRVLKRAGLVTATRSGREVIYHLAVPETSAVIDLAESVGRKAAGVSGSTAREARDADDNVHDLHPGQQGKQDQPEQDRDQDTDAEYTSGGKAAIVGHDPGTTFGEPGLTPSLPNPPVPKIT